MTGPGGRSDSTAVVGPGSAAAPRPVSVADQEAFETLTRDALVSIRSMVAAWRTGLTALITLVTTGVVLTGRTSTASMTTPWLAVVTATIGSGLALAILGLWQTLAAEVGARTRLHTLNDILTHHASVQSWQVAQAATAGRLLQRARILVAAALILLLTGVALTWWAPPAPTTPPGYLIVTTRTGASTCGTLISADNGEIWIHITGKHTPKIIPINQVANLSLTAHCP